MTRAEIETYLLHAKVEPASFVLDEQADLLEAAIRRELKWMPDGERLCMAFDLADQAWDEIHSGEREGDWLDPIRALLREAVGKALAEQRGEWIAALKAASGEYKCHPDFAEMWAKAEADPTYWAELLRSSRDAFREQEARHKREVIEARIEMLSVYGVTWELEGGKP